MLNYNELYRLPFSKNDNFNGWVEVTTKCNISCPGCYRGCDTKDHVGEHKPLDEIKAEIDKLVEIRNCSMISISGGEALMHPHIEEIVKFVKKRKLHPILFTNGVLLDKKRLTTLKKKGLTGVVVRMDSLQHTSKDCSEAELNSKRELFAKLCDDVGVHLTLTSVIDRSNISEIKDVINWAEKEHSRVGQLLLILKRNLAVDGLEEDESMLFLDEFIAQLEKDIPHLKFSGYLGSDQENQSAKWLQSFRLVVHGVAFGYLDKKYVELLQAVYHYVTGKYMGILPKKRMMLNVGQMILFASVNRSFRKAFWRFCLEVMQTPKMFIAPKTLQPITVVIPPHFVDGKRDLCDACPDAIFYKGKLVPSCALEEIIKYGKLYEKRSEE